MPTTEPRQKLEEFAEIIRRNESLAPYTALKIGGPAEMLVQPRTVEELGRVVRTCAQEHIPMRVLGTGGNILVRDEGVRGVVIRLVETPFTEVSVNGKRMRAGAGASLSTFISEAARHGLAGLESLVGVAGTVGGALRCNAGERSGEVGQFVQLVEVLDDSGKVQVRQREELRFAYRWSNLDDPVLLAAEFELDRDDQDAIVKRLRKTWIQRKATQPLSYQAAGRVFKAPSGFSASTLIAQGGLVGTRVGGAEISDRDANFIVAEPGTSARDVLRLIDMIRSRVSESSGMELELEMAIWG
jgi:UDP-N-acetylmuramate dehydrogenase